MKLSRLGMLALVLGSSGIEGISAQAALLATGDLSVVGSTGSGASTVYTYSLSLHDTGTTTVGTLWYAWIPAQDYMTNSPTSIQSPAGWTSLITGGNPGNGYAIQWKATSASSYAAAGSTLNGFRFDSLDTPAMLAGNSAFFPTTPVATTFVYSGAPFSDAGYQFLVTSVVPEVGSGSIVGAVGTLALLVRRRSIHRAH